MGKRIAVQMSFCDHSTEQLGCKPKNLPQGIVCGSQYDNALMSHTSGYRPLMPLETE